MKSLRLKVSRTTTWRRDSASVELQHSAREQGQQLICWIFTEEKDVFDSDFGSTDSGSGGEDDDGEDAGERRLERETRQARKVSRAATLNNVGASR